MISAPAAALFLDANILISAAWRDGTETALIWQLDAVRLITSDYVMAEVQRNLPRVDQIERLRTLLRSVQILSFDELPDIEEAAALPAKDRPVLAAAVQARAAHLVTGDKRHFGPWYGKSIRGVRITPPTDLLSVFRQQRP